MPLKKKKKVDLQALTSPFMRIPKMSVEAARCLLDIGFRECYELQGRCAEVLFEEVKKKKADVNKEFLYKFRVAIYYSENPDSDPKEIDRLTFD